MRMRNLLAEDSFRREALGIWDEQTAAEVIGEEAWHATEVANPQTDGLLSFGVDMPPDRSALAIGLAFKHDDGTAFISCRNTVPLEPTESNGLLTGWRNAGTRPRLWSWTRSRRP